MVEIDKVLYNLKSVTSKGYINSFGMVDSTKQPYIYQLIKL